MPDQYDLIVLGSGPGGYVAAIRSAQLGMKVAIVEREKLGGICLNWGCIPTKALLRTSEINHYLTHASAYGLSAEKTGFDLAKIVDRSRKVAGQLNAGVKGLMKKNKVAVVEGDGVITGKGTLSVTKDPGSESGAGGKKTDLAAKHIIAPALNTLVGGPSKLYEGSRAQIQGAIDGNRMNLEHNFARGGSRRWNIFETQDFRATEFFKDNGFQLVVASF